MTTVILGTLTLNWILDWKESEEVRIPRKTIPYKVTPTTEAGCFIHNLRTIQITCRLTTAERTTLYDLEDDATSQELSIDGDTEGFCWIERIEMQYRGDEESNSPWLTTIYLVVLFGSACSESGDDWAYFNRLNIVYAKDPKELDGGGYTNWHDVFLPDPFSAQGGGIGLDPQSCGVAKGSNAFANPSFESDFASWMISHANDFTIDGVVFYDGVKSARYEGTDASGAGPYIAQNLPTTINVNGCLDSGSIFSLYIKAETASTSIDYIWIQYTDHLDTSYISYTAPDTNWHEIDILSYATAGKVIEQVGVAFLGDGNKFWVDYFRLIP